MTTSSHSDSSVWTGMVPVDDTALAVTDTGGSGTPVVYLNGSYSTQKAWRQVIADLGPDFRHITYDERARGKSKRSADYSFDAVIRDLDVVLRTRGVDRPLLVGWSYGALLGVLWAARHPDRVAGVVGVDGPFPMGWTEEADLERVRKLFRRLRFVLPLAVPFGLAARMSAAQHAEIQVESHALHAALGPTLGGLTVPVRYVIAQGDHTGDAGGEMDQARASLDPLLVRNPNLQVSARVASNHEKILAKDSPAVAGAVRELAAAVGREVG
ncbi:alpha/beta fold hydrolase [Nocardia iowensis]|nr:alpha/beta fold hydrolase [Nocardia iowensis]